MKSENTNNFDWQFEYDYKNDMGVESIHNHHFNSDYTLLWDFIEKRLNNFDKNTSLAILFDIKDETTFKCMGTSNKRIITCFTQPNGYWNHFVVTQDFPNPTKEQFCYNAYENEYAEVLSNEIMTVEQAIAIFKSVYFHKEIPNQYKLCQKKY
jgi:hypothetical protein